MLVHTVFFYFKEGVTEQQIADCMEGAKTLGDIKDAKHYFVGTPADVADRPPLVKDYAFGLTGIFDSIADHDAYQVDPIHTKFIETFKPLWDRVVVYDYD